MDAILLDILIVLSMVLIGGCLVGLLRAEKLKTFSTFVITVVVCTILSVLGLGVLT